MADPTTPAPATTVRPDATVRPITASQPTRQPTADSGYDDRELRSLASVLMLDQDEQRRVIGFVADRLGLRLANARG